MRRIITLDIETIPAPEPENILQLDSKQLEQHLKTALNGDYGHILCIGYISEDDRGLISKGVLGWDEEADQFSCDEAAMLTEFWRMFDNFSVRRDVVVGHNIFDFDLKFIYKRSVIHGIRPSVELSFARYRNQPIFDTMYEWERWSYGNKISLDKLAKVLGLASSKDAGVDGSLVNTLFKAGQHRVIRDYCLRDVEVTRAIYRRISFAGLDERSVELIPAFANREARTVACS